MNKIFHHLACASLLLASAAAHAASYQFSYVFLNNDVVSGTFDGSANGNLITGLSNITVKLNGAAFGSDPFYAFGISNGYLSHNAVLSFDGKANQFLFADADLFLGDTPHHTVISAAYTGAATDVFSYYSAAAANGDDPDGTPYAITRWNVSAVPEPATYGMLLGGLALVGTVARRRKQA